MWKLFHRMNKNRLLGSEGKRKIKDANHPRRNRLYVSMITARPMDLYVSKQANQRQQFETPPVARLGWWVHP